MSDITIIPPERAPRRTPVNNHFPKRRKAIPASDPGPEDASPVPLSAGSILTPDQLAAVIRALAKPGEIGNLPRGMSGDLALRVAKVVATCLNLPEGPRPSRLGRPPEGPRLVARDRGDGTEPILYLHDKGSKRSTNFTESERDEAEAVVKLQKLFQDAAVVGMVLPTQVLVDVVIAYWLADRRPIGQTTADQAYNFTNDGYHVQKLLDFFGGKRLVDITPRAVEAFGDWRMSQPGLRRDRDGNPSLLSDQTVRTELDVLEMALKFWKAKTGMQWSPPIKKPKKNGPRVAWLYRGEAARALLGARGWQWDREAGGWKTIEVWDPLGREYFVDPVTRRLRSRRLGHGAYVLRPLVLRRGKRACRNKGVARALIIAYYTGTRAQALRLLRWDRNGVHGYPDLVGKILYRSDVGWPKTSKAQGPVDICPRLLQHLLRWRASDRANGVKCIVYNAWGRQFRALDGVIKDTMEMAGMNPMPVSADDLRFVDVKGNLIAITLHIYRHTFATMLLEMGVSPTKVANQLDVDPATMHGTYGHRAPGGTEDVREALDAMRLPDYRGTFQG